MTLDEIGVETVTCGTWGKENEWTDGPTLARTEVPHGSERSEFPLFQISPPGQILVEDV